MAISELYVVQHLLQQTVAERDGLRWEQKGSGGYVTQLNGVSIHFAQVESNIGSRLYITFKDGVHKSDIAEPINRGIVRTRYESEDQRQLAEEMRALADAISRQCADRELAAIKYRAAHREALFRRLLFGETTTPDPEKVKMDIT